MKRYFNIAVISFIIFLIAAIPLVAVTTPARGLTTGSQNVVLIGGNVFGYTVGGYLPTTGFSGGYAPSFTYMHPSAVSAASLASYDTAVLNMASSDMQCNCNLLTSQQKTDLNNFVSNGGKLIIYDSECWSSVDYTWLMYPFTTANPGALGAQGTLTIVEENVLSSANMVSPYYIDYGFLGTVTDAVGDMNVMTTMDPNWCLDMAGTNAINVTGPVHTYARYGSGLIIYNGLDQNWQPYPDLLKIWELELRVDFNPTPLADLPCGIAVLGISLNPVSATNPLNVNHQVTARVTDELGDGIPDIPVSFNITSGPNAGLTGGPINTDNDGFASWSWTSAVEGTDTVEATANTSTTIITSLSVTKLWEVAEIVEVGGDIYSVNKLTLLAPWVALAAALILGAAVVVRRRRARS